MHLARDLAVAYNDAFDAQQEAQSFEGVSWRGAKDEKIRAPLAAALRRAKYSMRMCLLSCFNLTEAFINGIAWEFAERLPESGNRRRMVASSTRGWTLRCAMTILPLEAGRAAAADAGRAAEPTR
jgi:hypothetical protein